MTQVTSSPASTRPLSSDELTELSRQIQAWASELGFQQTGISGIDLSQAGEQLLAWLDKGLHGEMDYMARHGAKRYQPQQLVAGTRSIISARMDYWPDSAAAPWEIINNPQLGYVSRYALGRDYHKLIRKRLQHLANRIHEAIGDYGYRVFTDSAPVMEKPIAELAGLGWQGKHTNLINNQAGSWFFLGEIYTDLPLPASAAIPTSHCGSCNACIEACPTGAIVAPYEVDARLCISYLTIELHGSIPMALRPMIGNRIYGCDDCQLVCPWNKFATPTPENDYQVRHQLDSSSLIELFRWSEAEFLSRMEGSAIRRLGHERWLRNIAVALGNGPNTSEVKSALHKREAHHSEMVREHIAWAIAQLSNNP